MKKLLEITRKICIMALLIIMCQSSFFGIYSVIAVENENNSANTANVTSTANVTNTENETKKAYMANGGKIGNFTIFNKGEEKNNVVQNLNVFCVQKGAPMSGGTFLYNGYNWNYDSEVFKDEESYKKFTWIKDNFWEEIGASKDNKYTTEQKLEIIKTVDKDTTITADDINKVYNSENEKHKLYQYIAWTYTKKVSNFNVDNESTINAYLGGKNTSLYKVYKAIRNLADAYFNNTDPMSINITQNEEIKYDETRSAYIWKLTVNNTFPLPYNKTLKVDGQSYEDFTYDGEELVINNIDQNGVHSFEFFVDTFRITSDTAYIWKNQYKQNLTEIRTKLESGQDKIDSNAGEVGSYSLNIKKVDNTDNNNVLDNMQFKVTKQDQSQIYTTDANGIAKIAESQNIESSNGKYTYTIEEISEVDSTVADKTNVKKYVKLKNPITINLISGVTVIDNIYVKYISAASFENGKNEIEASLINGKKVTLKLETATDTNDTQNTIVTLTIPNKEKEYDLALTKTILVSNNNLVEQFDMNLDGRIDISDYSCVQVFPANNGAGTYQKYYDETWENGNYYIEDEEVSEAVNETEIGANYAKAILGFFRNEISDEVARDKYNYLDSTYIIKRFINLDTDGNKIVSDTELREIVSIYAQNASGMDMDRINFINTNYLNTSEENETAIYNLNKVTYKVKKSDIIKYKITVYNEGNYNAKDIQITDYLPEGLVVCDENGNVVTSGNVSCKYNNKEYVWNINGKTATTTINDTINAYTGEKLNSSDVYITCKLEDNVDVGRILYNVAEISASTPVDDDGNEVTITDRDSEENSLSTVDDLIDKYKNNFEEKVNDEYSNKVNKDEYNYQDDDDFERIIIVEDSEFDLALRKSITKIGKSKDTMETKDRLPEINEQSAEVCAQYGTGEYNHGKEFILVERNDYIEYTIRIYNEGKDGDYAGYAKQITDYLPEGISFYAMVDADGSWITQLNEGKYVTTPNNFGYYKATYDEANNKVVIDCIDTPALETKNNLATLVNMDKDKIQSYYKNSGSLNSIAYGYQEIKIICKVSETAENLKLLTNLAEITKSVAINNGVEDETIPDRDSQYANITINNTSESNLSNFQVNLNTYYEERDVSDEDYSYYPGLQDDDDFETVKIECTPGTFKIKLVKYIKGTTNPLKDATFKITVNNGVEDVYSKDGLVTNEEGIIELEEEIDINKEGTKYTITVEETGVPEGYIGLSGSITFTAVSRINGSNLELTPNTLTVDNAKKVEINPGDILIEAENKPEPVIHKGVKTVENQNSGYDKNEIQTWVINSTIPAGISEYTKYIILDEMDPDIKIVADKRLIFLGTENVHIKIKGQEQELVAGTDYKVNFDEEKKILEITFIDGESFTAGKNLQEGSILEIKYDTKFALNDDGSIKGINQSIPNQAILKYNVGTPDDTTKESEKPEVHTGGVGIFKYDVKTKKALEGAHFKITRSLEKNANGEYNFIKVKDKDGNDTNVDLEVVTGSDGKAVFDGLEFGEDAINDATNKQADGTYTYDWTKAKTEYYVIETQTPEEYLPLEKPIQVTVKYDSFDIADLTKYYHVGNKPKIYDLSLRKFITQVEDRKITDREPNVILTDEFKDEENDNVTTAKYEHTKEPVIVVHGNIVTYTMRVYNEGLEDAYASLIKDDIPEGLEFVQYTEGDGSINDKYGWKLVDENDNEVTDPSKAKYIITDYLSMENGKINEDGSNSNLLKGFNSKTMDKLDYRDVEVQFRVTEPEKSERTITNYAQISKMTNSNGKVVIDRDSTPNAWVEGEDDQDIENIKLSYFDLALRKWVTEAIVIQDGKKVVTHTGHKAEDNPETVVKVDLKKSKVDSVEVKFAYKIRVTNEGKIGGYAKEVTDHIPDGLKFVQEDNPNWTLVDEKTITTDELKDVYLEHGESAEVTVVLTWINSKTNLGIKNNIAEISKDENEYGAHDVDSTPGNYKWGEDDIDDAAVMLAIKTGNEMIKYTMLGLAVITVLGIGINLVKRTKFI